MFNVPEWIVEYAEAVGSVLNLAEWDIRINIELAPGENPECVGLCEASSQTNSATITLRADVQENDYWRKVIIHELLHVKHARIDSFIEQGLNQILDNNQYDLMMLGYTQHYESYTDAIADVLLQLIGGKQDA